MESKPDSRTSSPTGTEVDKRGRFHFSQVVHSLIANRTARHVYLSLFDQVVISLSNFLGAIYLARNVSATQFGVYAVGFLLLRFVRALQEGLIVQPVNALGAVLNIRDFKRYFGATLLFQLLLSVVISSGAAMGGKILTDLGNDTAGPALFSLWFVFLSWPIQEFLRRAFYSRGDIPKAALISFISNTGRFFFLFWMGKQGSLDGAAGLDAIAWVAVIALIVGLWGARKYFTREIDLAGIWNTWIENWKSGRWVTGALLAHWVALEVYPLVVAGMISFAATGAYRALENLVAAVHVILRAMDTFITPFVARRYNREGMNELQKTLKWAYMLGGIPILGILLISLFFTVPLLKLFYEDAYLFMADGIVWLVMFYLLWFTYWPIQSAFKAIQHTRPLFTANLAAILCMFTLGLVAVHRWGVNGAYIGQGLNALVINIVLWRAWLKVTKKELQSDVPPSPRL